MTRLSKKTFPADTFETRLRQQRLADDRDDAAHMAKYPALYAPEEKPEQEASCLRTFYRRAR